MNRAKKPTPPTATKPETKEPEEQTAEPEEQTAETVQPRPGQPLCEECGGPMTVQRTTENRRYYKCETCGANKPVDRPPRVPRDVAKCPYHPESVCRRENRDGIVVDRCHELGCGYRQSYPPLSHYKPPEDFAAR